MPENIDQNMTLFIADTNDRVRQRLASIAASVEGITVVGEAGDVGNAIGGITRAKPDSVIVALQMLGGTGIDVLSAAKSTNPASVTIMLVPAPCSECQQKCFAMGADYVFEKSGEIKKIVTTLVLLAHQSNQQGFGLEREAAQSTVRSLPKMSEESDPFPLTVPATCPRIAAFPTPKSNVCFLEGSASRSVPRSGLRNNS
jgi:DNA-binding NarL/FixJ family response regulator